MKYLLLFLLALTFCGESIAQTVYESPHVHGGKTIQCIIPSEFFLVNGSENKASQQFATNPEFNPESDNVDSAEVGVLSIFHSPIEGQSLESLMEILIDQLADDETIVIARSPDVEEINGRQFLVTAYLNGVSEGRLERVFIGITDFGDYLVNMVYFSTEPISDQMTVGVFMDILATWNEKETSRVDGMQEEDISPIEEEQSTAYKNDLFETKLTYEDVLPDHVDHWDEPAEQNSHLLCEFTYKENHGSIKIFSGGSTSNYPSDEEKARAIEKAMEWNQPMTLTLNSQFSNEEHFFKLYSISGGGTMTSVYTTIVNRELVFFVVDGGDDPDEGFKPSVRDFMLTMWVDYFEEEQR